MNFKMNKRGFSGFLCEKEDEGKGKQKHREDEK